MMIPTRPKAFAMPIRITRVRMGLSHLRLKRRGLTHMPRAIKMASVYKTVNKPICTLVNSPTSSGGRAPGQPPPSGSGTSRRPPVPVPPGMGIQLPSNPGQITIRPAGYVRPGCEYMHPGQVRSCAIYPALVCVVQKEATRATDVQNGFDWRSNTGSRTGR